MLNAEESTGTTQDLASANTMECPEWSKASVGRLAGPINLRTPAKRAATLRASTAGISGENFCPVGRKNEETKKSCSSTPSSSEHEISSDAENGTVETERPSPSSRRQTPKAVRSATEICSTTHSQTERARSQKLSSCRSAPEIGWHYESLNAQAVKYAAERNIENITLTVLQNQNNYPDDVLMLQFVTRASSFLKKVNNGMKREVEEIKAEMASLKSWSLKVAEREQKARSEDPLQNSEPETVTNEVALPSSEDETVTAEVPLPKSEQENTTTQVGLLQNKQGEATTKVPLQNKKQRAATTEEPLLKSLLTSLTMTPPYTMIDSDFMSDEIFEHMIHKESQKVIDAILASNSDAPEYQDGWRVDLKPEDDLLADWNPDDFLEPLTPPNETEDAPSTELDPITPAVPDVQDPQFKQVHEETETIVIDIHRTRRHVTRDKFSRAFDLKPEDDLFAVWDPEEFLLPLTPSGETEEDVAKAVPPARASISDWLLDLNPIVELRLCTDPEVIFGKQPSEDMRMIKEGVKRVATSHFDESLVPSSLLSVVKKLAYALRAAWNKTK